MESGGCSMAFLLPAWFITAWPVVGTRARKIEPQAAIAVDGRSWRAQRCSAAKPALKLIAAGGRQATRV